VVGAGGEPDPVFENCEEIEKEPTLLPIDDSGSVGLEESSGALVFGKEEAADFLGAFLSG
jgi:hypothetical protein